MQVIEELGIDNLKIIQDDTLYRFTSDAVILSRFASSKKGDIVADFCSGSGIVGIHFYALNKNINSVDLFEIQKELYDISTKSIALNNLQSVITAYNTPLQEIPNTFNAKYTLILCNPPYKKKNSGETSIDIKKAMCKHEITITQDEIIEISAKKLNFGGRLCMCQRVERFTDMIIKMRECNLEPSRIQFVSTKSGNAPYLYLIEAVKGVKPQLKVLPTIVNGGF
ncbi:MAG: methyltransferase [Clostridia bacterium]|nr:methyltransferase [Clostridia bacterium]